MKKLYAAALACTFTMGGLAFGQAKPQLSSEQARAIALQAVPGAVVEEELETENGLLVYSFEIRPTGIAGGGIKEVEIDANTGKLVGIEDEDD